jgi:hypothetical protein
VTATDAIPEAVAAFLARWEGVTGHDRANYQLFLAELTALLGLPTLEPAEADHRRNAYCFERRVSFRHGDGSESVDPCCEGRYGDLEAKARAAR